MEYDIELGEVHKVASILWKSQRRWWHSKLWNQVPLTKKGKYFHMAWLALATSRKWRYENNLN